MPSLLRSAALVASVALLLCSLLPSISAQTLSICYTLQGAPYTVYGNWSSTMSATFAVAPVTLPATYAYTGSASAAYTTVYSITGVTSGTRTFTTAVGATYSQTLSTSAFVAANYTYAPSGITAALNTDNYIFVNPTTNAWTTSAAGFGINVGVSTVAGYPGLPGFPKTARFNTVQYLIVSSVMPTAGTNQLLESGVGQITIDGNIGAAAVFTPTVTNTPAVSSLGAVSTTTASAASATAPSCPAPTNTVAAQNFINQGFCYILYPHETQQNGNYSIATSGLLQTSPTAVAVPGSATGSPNRMAYLIYGLSSLTRTYIDQFGNTNTASGAFVQGQGGDGGTDNYLYTSLNTSDTYGGLVDGDGFTFTFYTQSGSTGTYGGATTPGDPTQAYAINFYYQSNYREAAEPWHQDEEYAAYNISGFTVTTGATAAPSCTAGVFPKVTPPPNFNTPVTYSFCSYMTANTSAPGSVGAWTVITQGTLSVTSSYFTSFATADAQFYQIGTAMSGTRTYISSTGANQTLAIGALQPPGGDGQNSNKLYNQTTGGNFDNGGWSYTISGATVPGVSAAGTSNIRLYYTGTYWTEQALPSFQTAAPSDSSASYFKYQPSNQGAINCVAGGGAGSGNGAAPSAAGSSSALLLAGAAAAGAALLL